MKNRLVAFLLVVALSFPTMAGAAAKRILRVTVVSVENDGSRLSIMAVGQANTPGWTNLRLTKLSSTKQELTYAFVGTPPTEIVPQQLVTVHAQTTFTGVAPLQVRVRSANNSKVASVPRSGRGKDESPSAQTVTAIGKLTAEGVVCQAMREDGTNVLYTLSGNLHGFKTGDHVKVSGTLAETSICQQGMTINVSSITRQ